MLHPHDVPGARAGRGIARAARSAGPSGDQKPEVLATAPNQLWSWDITKLLGPAKWTYFYLYVALDVFSRYVVAWMIAHREGAELAEAFIAETIAKHGIPPGQLTLHADRGRVMCSKPVVFLLAGLGVTKTHSRPYVSDDNPYSESQFRTLEVPSGIPRPLWGHRGRPRLRPRLLPVVQRRASALGTRAADAGGGPLRRRPGRAGPAPGRARRRLRGPSRRFVRHAPVPLPLPSAVWINKPRPAAVRTEERRQ